MLWIEVILAIALGISWLRIRELGLQVRFLRDRVRVLESWTTAVRNYVESASSFNRKTADLALRNDRDLSGLTEASLAACQGLRRDITAIQKAMGFKVEKKEEPTAC